MLDRQKFKKKAAEELRQLLFLTIYLTLFFNSLTIYKSLILQQNIFSYFHMGYNFFEALILAKIIMIGNMLKIGEKYTNSSLAIPTLYKALTFSLFTFLFTGLEHVVLSLFEGQPITFPTPNVDIGHLLIAFLFFIPLFSFLELSREIGHDRTFKLFFHRTKGH